jgi:hypothetical protein
VSTDRFGHVFVEATHWGTRWFVVRDPDGNLVAFEQRT